MPANIAPSSRTSSIASSADISSSTSQQQQQQQNAALLGATAAFGRQPPKPRAPLKTIGASAGSSNGALSATMSASHRGRSEHSPARSSSRSPLPGPGFSGINERRLANVVNMAHVDSGVQPPRPTAHDQSPSHSHKAAVLAAARAKPTVAVEHTQQAMMRAAHRPVVGPKPDRIAMETTEKPTDTTPIAPTTSLVHLFEQRSRTTVPPGKRPEPVVGKPSQSLPLSSPKLVRSGGITSMIQLELEGNNGKQAESVEAATKRHDPAAKHYGDQGHSSEDSYASASEDPINRTSPLDPTSSAYRAASPSCSDRLRSQSEAKRRPQPSPSPQRTNGLQPVSMQHHHPRPISAQMTGGSVSSMRSHMSIAAQFNAAHPRRMTPLRTGDDLANALVASSLASSRAPSPTRLEPPPVPSRRRNGGHRKFPFSRTPSPTKASMPHTLRKQADTSSSDSEDGRHLYRKHHKKRLVRKHPNKHHEGDRKRWRDAVTERERKRYEGVWAANKGLYYSFSPEEQDFFRKHPTHERTQDAKAGAGDSVSNIVARDIWNRSRLPATALELVWNLVDNDGVGRLCKEEFVVGMWLIDQRLKGRKLPMKVSESVWASVRGIGVKVRR